MKPDGLEVGVKGSLVRNEDHEWWGYAAGKGGYLDRIEFIDYGTDPAAWVAAAEADEVDTFYETVGDFVDIMDGLGWEKSEIATGSTIVIRPNQVAEVDGKKPYADVRVRRAIAHAVDVNVCLELGIAGMGATADNTHVGPMHPEYADVPGLAHDPAGAMALLKEAGMENHEFDIVSIDDDWRKNTTDCSGSSVKRCWV